eukprot:3681332-Pyramimonas_sp.AAC.1
MLNNKPPFITGGPIELLSNSLPTMAPPRKPGRSRRQDLPYTIFDSFTNVDARGPWHLLTASACGAPTGMVR